VLRACSRISPVRIDRFAPDKVSRPAPTLAGMSHAIALTDEQWEPVADLFEPPGRRGAPAQIPRRQMVEAMLFLARTGCQWRYLPERYGPWTAVWAQWRRWRSNGVWARAVAHGGRHPGAPRPGAAPLDGHGRRPDG